MRTNVSAGMTRAVAYGAMATGITAVATLVRSKAMAYFVGPRGVGTIGELTNVATLATVPLMTLVGPALLSASAKARAESTALLRDVTRKTTLLLVAAAVPACVMAIAIAWNVAPEAMGSTPWLVVGATGSVWVSLLQLIPRQYFGAIPDHRRIAITVAAGALPTTLGAILGLWLGGTAGFFTGIVMAGGVASVAILVPLLRSDESAATEDVRARSAALLRSSVSVGVSSLLGGLVAQALQLAVRQPLDLDTTGSNAGYFQAALALSTNMVSTLTVGVLAQTLPVSAGDTVGVDLARHLETGLAYSTRFAVPVLLVAQLFRPEMLQVLFSGQFVGASSALALMVAAEFLRSSLAITGSPLLYRGLLRPYLAGEAVGAVSTLIAARALTPHFGAAGATSGYVVGLAIQLVLHRILLASLLGTPIRARVVAGTLAGGLVLSGTAAVTGPLWYRLAGAAVLLPALFALSHPLRETFSRLVRRALSLGRSR